MPSAKDTLAPLVIKILKQCYWQSLLSFQRCNGVLEIMGAISSPATWGQAPKHSSTSSGQTIKTMILAKLVIISKM